MPIEPDMAELIETAIDSRLLDVHTMIIGTVVSYNAAKQAAVVAPVVNGAAPNADGTTTSETLPSIPNVPVRWERAGGYYDHKPLAAGDSGMLIFSESAFALWRVSSQSGQVSDPGDLSRHGLSYPYFVPGCWTDANPLPDAPTDHAVSIVQNFLRVSKANSTTADFVALAAKVEVELNKIATALASATWPGGTSAAPVVYGTPYTSPGAVAATSLKTD